MLAILLLLFLVVVAAGM